MPLVRRSDKHLYIEANAGTGKTTTIVQAVYRMLNLCKPQWLKGSKEQELIWEEACKGQEPNEIRIATFGKKNATDITNKLKTSDTRIKVSTVHAFGLSLLTRCGVNENRSKNWVNFDKDQFLLCDALGEKNWQSLSNKYKGLIKFAKRIVSLIKSDDIDVTDDPDGVIEMLCLQHGIEASAKLASTLASVLPELMERHLSVSNRMINHDDMVWLPNKLGLLEHETFKRIDLAIVDEAQDLNPMQRKIMLAAARRTFVVGDTRQAIMGFQGADVSSMPNFKKALEKTSLGVSHLLLTESFRCPKAIVPMVKSIVPSFSVTSQALPGSLTVSKWADVSASPDLYLAPKDKRTLFVGRRNAYLVSMAIRLIVKNIACVILGRDFGEDLCELLRKFTKNDDDMSCSDLFPLIEEWERSEIKKVTDNYPDPTDMVILIADKATCLKELTMRDYSATVGHLIKFITNLFQDTEDDPTVLATVHKAKGLEADTVVFLAYDACPDPKVKPDSIQYPQEMNILYVACTRTRDVLHLVTQMDEDKAKVSAPSHPLSAFAKKSPDFARAEKATKRTLTEETQVIETHKLDEARRQQAIEYMRSLSPEELESLVLSLQPSLTSDEEAPF